MDREKVISQVEEEVRLGKHWDESDRTISIELLENVLLLLKEQEPKPVKVVKVVKNAYNHEFYYCPRCDRSFYELSFGKPKFCDKCGQAVKWK